MATTKKTVTRWDWIEERWQEALLSTVQIGKRHGELFGKVVAESSIRERASKWGWQRDTDQAIRREVRSQLTTGLIPIFPRTNETDTATDSPFREENREVNTNTASLAETQQERVIREETTKAQVEVESLVEIGRRQLAEIADARDIANRMSAYVRAHLVLNPDGTARDIFEPGELKDLIGAASSTAYTRVRVINTERRIFNMDDKDVASMNDDGTLTAGKQFIPLATLNVTVNRSVRPDPIVQPTDAESAGSLG